MKNRFWVLTRGDGPDYDLIRISEVSSRREAKTIAKRIGGKVWEVSFFNDGYMGPDTILLRDHGID